MAAMPCELALEPPAAGHEWCSRWAALKAVMITVNRASLSSHAVDGCGAPAVLAQHLVLGR